MQEILSALLTVCTNIIVLCSVPFIWWLVKWKKEVSFFEWVGLYTPKLKANWWVVGIYVIAYAIEYLFDWGMFMPETDRAIFDAKAVADAPSAGIYAIVASFIVNVFANGFCEEVFFRGFLTKRMISKLGFWPGVIAPSALFAVTHNILWLIAGFDISIIAHLVMFSQILVGGMLLAYLNERICNGSMIPSFLVHGLGNFFSF